MGDRANVFVRDYRPEGTEGPTQGVYLYTHWAGTRLPWTVALALGKRWRWSDGSYLTRIIFDEMTVGHQGAETGFGISATIGDNGHPIVVVDPQAQRIGFCAEGEELNAELELGWTFQEYTDLAHSAIEAAYEGR